MSTPLNFPVLRSLLASFSSSPSPLQIISTIPKSPSSHSKPVKTLYVLDSSFNPPTLAHRAMAIDAVSQDNTTTKRLLLLLATQNADKPPKPAAFEHRIIMMGRFAEALAREKEGLVVDVGITKHPYYADKAAAISESGFYSEGNGGIGVKHQVHLLGYDSLIRLLDTKYYPPDHSLQGLGDFFAKHRVVVRLRAGDKWGSVEEQERWIKDLQGRHGELERRGGNSEWAEKIEVEAIQGEGEESISSTKVRDAVKREDREALRGMVGNEVVEYVFNERLYQEQK